MHTTAPSLMEATHGASETMEGFHSKWEILPLGKKRLSEGS